MGETLDAMKASVEWTAALYGWEYPLLWQEYGEERWHFQLEGKHDRHFLN